MENKCISKYIHPHTHTQRPRDFQLDNVLNYRIVATSDVSDAAAAASKPRRHKKNCAMRRTEKMRKLRLLNMIADENNWRSKQTAHQLQIFYFSE